MSIDNELVEVYVDVYIQPVSGCVPDLILASGSDDADDIRDAISDYAADHIWSAEQPNDSIPEIRIAADRIAHKVY